MALNLQGSPKTQFDVAAEQITPSISSIGKGIVQGPTQRGPIGKAVFINNSIEYSRVFGGELANNPFPIYARRLLEGGSKLWIIRPGHYTTPSDKTTLTGTKAAATISISANNSIWNALDVGDGYNGTTIVITTAKSGIANNKDIAIKMNGADNTITLQDVARTMNAAAIIDFNNALVAAGAQIKLVSIATQIENGAGTLAGGVQDVTAIIAADYTGDSTQGTGWFAADVITDAMRIANLGLVGDEDTDDGLRAYVNLRGNDMRYYIGTPLGVNDIGMLAYRNGTTPYSNGAVNEWLGELVGGDVLITDYSVKNKTFTIPGIVDVFGRRLLTDAKSPSREGGQWRSHAGPDNGVIVSPNLGVPYNLGSPALAGNFDNIYPKGINAVINKDGVVQYWGNKTLWSDTTKPLLSKSNVADAIIYMIRTLRPVVNKYMFKPNDVKMWKDMYREALTLILGFETNRIIIPGENDNWFWQGDQDVDKRGDAKFNTQTDIQNGIYKVKFIFIPIDATEFIGISMIPTDSNSVQFVVTQL